MSGQMYYYLTSLPALHRLDEEPPVDLDELLGRLGEDARGREQIEALLLGDDLLQREAFLSGSLAEPAPHVLDAAQVRDEAPLPDFLEGRAPERPGQLGSDALWSAYYRYLFELAQRTGSRFLADWLAWQIGLRNALAAARAKALNLEPSEWKVLPELGRGEEEYASLLNEWSAAETPLEGLRALDQGRWAWLDLNAPYYSFTPDELLAYAARLMLMTRWQRLSREGEDTAAPTNP
jgi:hypothetical protein